MSAEATARPAAGADPLVPRPFRVTDSRRETYDTVTLELEALDGGGLAFAPGQFTMLGPFGVGEVPISISGHPDRPDRLVHTVRDVGGVTRAICAAEPGAVLGVRGPYGEGWGAWDAAGGDVVIVAGGIGLAPLRPAVLKVAAARERFGAVHVLYGARTADDLLFGADLATWASEADIHVAVIVDRAPTSWVGRVGLVTELIPSARFDPARTLAFVCGPELMMRYVAAELVDVGVPGERVRLSMERNMRCGVGLCGHCQLREFLVCVDGPVFSLAEMLPVMGAREL
ncbi:MAG TPA: FAD/NAD(P)-binding protein [Nocardioidaceae bacterium]|nr:FAD/NAD(P)-binding protein [Nocardioidaceae bacterium]